MAELPKLTSLRFVFAAWVFISHNEFLFEEDSWYQIVMKAGYAGVAGFFILSGFILSYIYAEGLRDGTVSARQFYVRRLSRIYPLYFLTLVLSVPLSISNSSADLKVFATHLLMLQSYFPDRAIYFAFNAPAWSVSNEIFFYALFPLIILYPYRSTIIYAVFAVILLIVGLAVNMDAIDHYVFYINPLVRLGEFLFGFWLYRLWSQGILLPRYTSDFALVLLVLCAWLSDGVPEPLSYAYLFYLPFGALILSCASDDCYGVFHRFLSHRITVYLGKISYGIYLYQFLVLSAMPVILRWFEIKVTTGALLCFSFSFTVVLATFSYEMVEKPLSNALRMRFSSTTEQRRR